jgi:2'-5' RNA ligase
MMTAHNSYALVAYLSDPIARFVDQLRREFTPDCTHRAHITVLPPRPLRISEDAAREHFDPILRKAGRFEIRLGAVSLFERSDVIKIEITSGTLQLRALHDSLNVGPLHQKEEWDYVPHVTLGQDIPAERVAESLAIARRRWEEYGSPPPIVIPSLTFVQQVDEDCWRDLVTLPLGSGSAGSGGPSAPVGVLASPSEPVLR